MAEADPHKLFDVHVAQTDLPTLVDRAHAGEEIVLAKAGVPWAKIVPFSDSARPKRQPGRYRHLLGHIPSEVWFDPLPKDELDAWEGKYSNVL